MSTSASLSYSTPFDIPTNLLALLSPHLSCQIVCSLVHYDHDTPVLTIRSVYGTLPHDAPRFPVSRFHRQWSEYTTSLVASELGVQSNLMVISTALASHSQASRTYSLASSRGARSTVARLLTCWAAGVAIFIAHDVPAALVRMGPYPVPGGGASAVVPVLSPVGVVQAPGMVARSRLRELWRQVGRGEEPPLPPVQRSPFFSEAAFQRLSDRLARSNCRFVVMRQAFVDGHSGGLGGDFLASPSFLHHGYHGYFFPPVQRALHNPSLVPVNDAPSIVPEPGQPFELFVRWAEGVEYLGQFRRVPARCMWTWYRLAPEEWTAADNDQRARVINDAIVRAAAGYSVAQQAHVRRGFGSGTHTLGAVFLQCLQLNAHITHSPHT